MLLLPQVIGNAGRRPSPPWPGAAPGYSAGAFATASIGVGGVAATPARARRTQPRCKYTLDAGHRVRAAQAVLRDEGSIHFTDLRQRRLEPCTVWLTCLQRAWDLRAAAARFIGVGFNFHAKHLPGTSEVQWTVDPNKPGHPIRHPTKAQ